MPTQLQAPGKSGAVSKRDQELKPRKDMLADVNLPQRPQVLGPEERDGSCELPIFSCLGYFVPNGICGFPVIMSSVRMPLTDFITPKIEGEFGLETPQWEISETASFHNEMVGEVTRDGSWCSILEKLWEEADQTKRDQKNQSKPSHQGAFLNKKKLNTERDCDYKDPGEIIHARPHLVSSRKRPHKHCSFAKRHVGRDNVTDVEVAVVLGEQVHIVEEDPVPVLLLHGLPEPHVVKLAPVEGGVVHLGFIPGDTFQLEANGSHEQKWVGFALVHAGPRDHSEAKGKREGVESKPSRSPSFHRKSHIRNMSSLRMKAVFFRQENIFLPASVRLRYTCPRSDCAFCPKAIPKLPDLQGARTAGQQPNHTPHQLLRRRTRKSNRTGMEHSGSRRRERKTPPRGPPGVVGPACPKAVSAPGRTAARAPGSHSRVDPKPSGSRSYFTCFRVFSEPGPSGAGSTQVSTSCRGGSISALGRAAVEELTVSIFFSHAFGRHPSGDGTPLRDPPKAGFPAALHAGVP
eukprot:bmy_21599T0